MVTSNEGFGMKRHKLITQELEGIDERHLIPHEKDLDMLQQEMKMLEERSKIIQEKGFAAMTKEDWDYLLEPTRMVSEALNVNKEKLKQAPNVPEDTDVIVDTEEEAQIKNQQREAALQSTGSPTPEQQRRQDNVWSILDLSRFSELEMKPESKTLASFINEEPSELPPDEEEESADPELDDLKMKYKLYRERIKRRKARKRTSRS